MTLVLLTIFVVFVILLGSEIWWRRRAQHGEFTRKFVHITVGSFVAFWPFYLSWNQIRWLSLSFLIVVGISKYFHVLRAIHSVQRPTWGELYFALATGLLTFITHDKWIYMAALLQMSLADGLAAIVGVRYGARQSYLVFSHRKSLAGTATFFIVSMGILAVYADAATVHLSRQLLIGTAGLAAIIENLGVAGWDNLFVPVVVALILVVH